MRRACVLLIAVFVTRPLNAEVRPLWIVVTAPAFRQAVEPLCKHRRAEGMNVVVVQTSEVLTKAEILHGDASKLRDHVRKLCKTHLAKADSSKTRCYLLLVGAVSVGAVENPETVVVPPMRGTISRMKGEPTDTLYGCLDESRLPTVAVGRFPARTVAEARAMVAKTIALEKNTKPGRWRRRVTILAGMPAFNPLVDKLVENLAMARVAKISPAWSGQAIYHNAGSRFTVPDPLLRQRALDYVEEGQLVIFYLGHSNARGFYAGRARYLDRDDWRTLKIRKGGSILFTFGCNGCQLGGFSGEGYGIHAIRNPHGPVGVVGSHGICFSAMVHLACDRLFERAFAKQMPERLGDCWLACLEGISGGKIGSLAFGLLDKVDGDPRIPQKTQRQEHLEMFLLFGDPALRLPRYQSGVKLDVPNAVPPGEKLRVRGRLHESLDGARVVLTLERTLDSVPANLEPIPKPTSPDAVKRRDEVLLANHRRANRFVVTTRELRARDGRFEAEFEMPTHWPGRKLIVRAYAVSKSAEAQGTAVVEVPKREEP